MRSIKFLVLSILCIASFLLLASGVHAAPATFVVTNTNDSGAGSLRQAIEDANGNGNPSDMDVIEFNIAGSGVHRITPDSELPAVSEMVTIDGYSQPGASPNTAVSPLPFNAVIRVEVDGSGLDNEQGFIFINGSDGSLVRGLAIFGFGENQIFSDGVSGVAVYGVYLNVDSSGMQTIFGPSGRAVAFRNSVESFLGGPLPAQRNLIASQTAPGPGTEIHGSGNRVLGNYFGIARDGVTDLESTFGIDIQGDNTQVGGSGSGDTNLLSGASTAQITITGGAGSVIQGNYIGTDYTGNLNSAISNGGGIVVTYLANDPLIGGTAPGEGNTIRGVSGLAISVVGMDLQAYSMVLNPNRISVLGNVISDVGIFDYPNFGDSNLAIDIASNIWYGPPSQGEPDEWMNQGPTANDVADTDTGPNGYMNTPVLKTAQQVGDQLTITYDLDAADSPSDTYRVEFFANDNSTVFGAGPAQEFIGTDASVSPGSDQSVTFTVSGDYTDKVLSSTTTAIDITTDSGFGSTSELSRNISVGSEDDFDADGIADAVEDAAPNSGDGNNDGIDDRLQPTVSSYSSADGTTRITFVTDGCSENGTVSSLDVGTLEVNDNGYLYPHGMTDFSLNCSRGDTVDVTMYTYTDTDPSSFLVRKYNPSTNSFRDVPGASLVRETLGSNSVLKLTYSITDGGELDDDGMTNGIIVDPVGLAIESTNGQAGGSLADTGDDVRLVAFLIGMLIVGGGSMLLRLRRRS